MGKQQSLPGTQGRQGLLLDDALGEGVTEHIDRLEPDYTADSVTFNKNEDGFI